MKEQDREVGWFNTIFYPQNRTGRATGYETSILPRLREREVVLFTPWGPRYSWETRGTDIKQGDREIETLARLAWILRELESHMPSKRFCWIFMGADLYGTRINNLPNKIVVEYFSSLQSWLVRTLPRAEFRLWSEFDKEAERYRNIAKARLEELVSTDLLIQAAQTAKSMGKGGDPREYLVERLAEAMLIETTFHPIKISCVVRRKDDEVDWALPRLYLLPEHLHAPWL